MKHLLIITICNLLTLSLFTQTGTECWCKKDQLQAQIQELEKQRMKLGTSDPAKSTNIRAKMTKLGEESKSLKCDYGVLNKCQKPIDLSFVSSRQQCEQLRKQYSDRAKEINIRIKENNLRSATLLSEDKRLEHVPFICENRILYQEQKCISNALKKLNCSSYSGQSLNLNEPSEKTPKKKKPETRISPNDQIQSIGTVKLYPGMGGKVYVKYNGYKNWQEISNPVDLRQGDKLRTSYNTSGAHLIFDNDNMYCAVKDDATITIGDSYLYIERGNLRIKAYKTRGNAFKIITPTAIAGCFDSPGSYKRRLVDPSVHQAPPLESNNDELEFDVNVSDNSTDVIVYKGQVILSNNVSEKIIRAGEMTSISSSDEQIVVRSIDNNNTSTNNSNSTNSPSISNIWSMETYSNNLQIFEQEISSMGNKGMVPVGLNCTDSQFEVLYLGGDVLSTSSWNMEWYNDASTLQQGINKNMNEGYIPTGYSWSGSAHYVMYIKTDFTAQAWQIIPSALDLNAVSTAIQPYVDQNYVPMGISLFGDEYYTLLVQFDEPLTGKWLIEGYRDNANEIFNNINEKINQGSVPWGLLKKEGVANILYVGF